MDISSKLRLVETVWVEVVTKLCLIIYITKIVHMLLAPPPGEIPVKKSPSAISWSFGNKAIPNPNADSGMIRNWQTQQITKTVKKC